MTEINWCLQSIGNICSYVVLWTKEAIRRKTVGEMQFLNETGHSTLAWDVADHTSIGIAEAEFDKLLHEGYVAFQREHKEKEAQRVDTFDPTADEILWLRPLQGG